MTTKTASISRGFVRSERSKHISSSVGADHTLRLVFFVFCLRGLSRCIPPPLRYFSIDGDVDVFVDVLSAVDFFFVVLELLIRSSNCCPRVSSRAEVDSGPRSMSSCLHYHLFRDVLLIVVYTGYEFVF